MGVKQRLSVCRCALEYMNVFICASGFDTIDKRDTYLYFVLFDTH